MCSKAQKHVHVHLVEEKPVIQKHVHVHLVEEKRVTVSGVTDKHREFVTEPMGEKSVTMLPGVGPVFGKRLVTAGFDKAYVILGQFLVLKKNQQSFTKWMEDTCFATRKPSSATRKQSLDCWQGLNDWCKEFL